MFLNSDWWIHRAEILPEVDPTAVREIRQHARCCRTRNNVHACACGRDGGGGDTGVCEVGWRCYCKHQQYCKGACAHATHARARLLFVPTFLSHTLTPSLAAIPNILLYRCTHMGAPAHSLHCPCAFRSAHTLWLERRTRGQRSASGRSSDADCSPTGGNVCHLVAAVPAFVPEGTLLRTRGSETTARRRG